MERKILKIGNSLGVIIPTKFLNKLDVDHKDSVEMEFNEELQTLIIRNNNKKTTPNDDYLEQVVKGVVDKYLHEKGL